MVSHLLDKPFSAKMALIDPRFVPYYSCSGRAERSAFHWEISAALAGITYITGHC